MFRRLLLLFPLWETVPVPFLHTNRRLIFILSPLVPPPPVPRRFSFSFPRASSIVVVLQASSCALVGKRKSSLPFGSWNQFRKYLVPTTILPKPLIRRHVGSYGRNRANAFAFQRPEGNASERSEGGDTKSRIKWDESKHLFFTSNIHGFFYP